MTSFCDSGCKEICDEVCVVALSVLLTCGFKMLNASLQAFCIKSAATTEKKLTTHTTKKTTTAKKNKKKKQNQNLCMHYWSSLKDFAWICYCNSNWSHWRLTCSLLPISTFQLPQHVWWVAFVQILSSSSLPLVTVGPEPQWKKPVHGASKREPVVTEVDSADSVCFQIIFPWKIKEQENKWTVWEEAHIVCTARIFFARTCERGFVVLLILSWQIFARLWTALPFSWLISVPA